MRRVLSGTTVSRTTATIMARCATRYPSAELLFNRQMITGSEVSILAIGINADGEIRLNVELDLQILHLYFTVNPHTDTKSINIIHNSISNTSVLCEMYQKVEIKQEPVWLEGGASTSFPAADIKDEIIIEEQSVDQLVPLLKEEDRFYESFNPEALAVQNNLKSRKAADIGNKPNHCSLCRKTFRRKSELKRHNIVHTKERPHYCTLCGKAFSQRCTLQKHMFVHTGERRHHCALCGRAFSDKSALKRHILIHTGEQPYFCNICGRKFREKSKLKTHTLIHTGERPYQCTLCDKTFSRKWSLRKHTVHHSRGGTYRCNLCGKTFPEISDLETHNDSRLYVCNLCSRTFCAKYILKMHMFYHTGERPHLCTLCGKAFSLESRLKKHIVLHTAPRLRHLLTINKTQGKYDDH